MLFQPGYSKPNANGYTDSITDGYSNTDAYAEPDVIANSVTNVNIFTLHPLCFLQKGILVATFHQQSGPGWPPIVGGTWSVRFA